MDNSIVQRMPPQNMEAEMSVLGSLMLDKDALIKIGDVVSADDFYDDRHKLIFEAAVALSEKNISIDILTMTNWLEERKILEKVGGSSYLTQLVNEVPSSAHISHYAFIVRKKGALRKLIGAAGEMTNMAFNEEGDMEDILDSADQKLFNISQKHLKQNFVSIGNILHATLKESMNCIGKKAS